MIMLFSKNVTLQTAIRGASPANGGHVPRENPEGHPQGAASSGGATSQHRRIGEYREE